MKISTLLVLLGLSVTAATATAADEVTGNAAAGATKVAVCEACHGEAGKAPIAPIYPSLAGQSSVYLQSSMIAYRDGLRQGGMVRTRREATTIYYRVADQGVHDLIGMLCDRFGGESSTSRA